MEDMYAAKVTYVDWPLVTLHSGYARKFGPPLAKAAVTPYDGRRAISNRTTPSHPRFLRGVPHAAQYMRELPMNQEGLYLVSIQAQPFRKKTRYYWTICSQQTPDFLVSWGHAESQALAEAEAGNE